MSYCVIGIHEGVKKAIAGKSYYSYDENLRFIKVLPSYTGKINQYNSYSVATSLANLLNKSVNEGLPVKIGPIFKVSNVGGVNGVEWAISQTQSNILNDAYDNKYKKLFEQDYKERSEEYFEQRMKEEMERGIDFNMSDDETIFSVEKDMTKVNESTVKQKYFSTSNVRKISDLLVDIARSNYSLAPLAKKLLEYAKINDINVILKATPYFLSSKGVKGAANYSSSSNTISIAEFSNLVANNPERVILHEILHAFSYHVIRRDGSYSRAFREVYSKSIEKLGVYDPISKEGYYGNYTIDEFFVALFTDPEFIKRLQSEKPVESKEFKNLFEEVMDLIFSLLKIEKNTSLYTQAFSIASSLLDEELMYTNEMLNQMGITQSEFDKVNGDMMIVEEGKDFVLVNSARDLNLSEEKIDEIYNNYVNLMDRKREGKSISKSTFESLVLNGQTFVYKNTYIFGEWDKRKSLFKGRIMSSPGIRELYEAIDVVHDNLNFMASVPEDMGKMLSKKGFYKLEVDKPYNFKGEEMIKNLYFTNKELVEKVFNKPAKDVTYENVSNYDTFFNKLSLSLKLEKAYKSGKYMEAFPYLRELGLYDYSAYRLVKKAMNKPLLDKEIKAVMNQIKKNTTDKLVNIDRRDILNNPIIYSMLDNDVNKELARYLSNFGIKTELLSDLQTSMGIDSLATVDLLNKIIYSDITDQSQYAEQAGKLIAYMMQHNPLVTDIFAQMKSLKRFKGLTKDEMIDAVGEMIANELYQRKQLPVPQSLLDKLKTLISDFFDLISRVKIRRINKNVGFIVDNILLQNQATVTASVYKPGAAFKPIQRISLKEALESDEFGNDIVDRMADFFVLTGSITLAEQGTVYRPSENQIHDLDWVSPLDKETTIKIFYQLYPDAIHIRTIDEPEARNSTETWLIAPEGYSIINLKLEGKNNKVVAYDIADSEGNIVSSFIPSNEDLGISEGHTGEIEAKLIDIFIYENEEFRKEDVRGVDFKLPSGKILVLSNWQATFRAKLKYGRIKDIWDYNRFIPNDNIYRDEAGPTKSEPTKLLEITPKSPTAVYTAVFVDVEDMVNKYGQVHPNLYSHHSTIEFKPSDITGLPLGSVTPLKVIGRLTTDKVDVLLVDNPMSKNKYPHITLSTAEGVKPFESNSEIENNLDKVQPVSDTLDGVIGYHNGITEVISEETLAIEETNIKEGVADLFEANPELIFIGTAQEYSDYLDTTTDPSMEGFQEYMDFKNNVKDYFNLNDKQANFVKDQSNLNINC